MPVRETLIHKQLADRCFGLNHSWELERDLCKVRATTGHATRLRRADGTCHPVYIQPRGRRGRSEGDRNGSVRRVARAWLALVPVLALTWAEPSFYQATLAFGPVDTQGWFA